MNLADHRRSESRSCGRFRGLIPAPVLLLAGLLVAGACGDSPAGPDEIPSPQGAVEMRASVRSPTVRTLVVEVTAPDIPEAVVFNLELEGTDTDGDGVEDEFTASELLTVPAGADRLFTVRAFDTGGVRSHEGSARMDVTPGINTSAVVVILRPLSGDQPIEVVLGSFDVTVTPETATIEVGATQQFTAEVTDENGPVDGTTVAWATTNPGVAPVDATGLASGEAEGTADIVATYGGVAGTAALTVGAPSETPTGDEVCDGVDNDGDGQVDEGLTYCVNGEPAPNTDGETCNEGFVDANDDPADGCEATLTTSTYHEDADADGYGNPDVSTEAETQPEGYVLDGTDCDDADATVHPGAPELVDGQDNDCDGVLLGDEVDDDADGYVEGTIDVGGWDGDPSVVGGGDCDDGNPGVHPGAEEIADGIDNDCDGVIDESA